MEFDCLYCMKKERHKGRVCFLRDKEQFLRFPILDSNGKIVEWEKRMVTKKDVCELIMRVHDFMPNKLVTDVLNSVYLRIGLNGEPVCAIGLFDPFHEWLVSLETAASKYHVLPFAGGYLDQPEFIIDAFDAIRAAEAKYQNMQLSKMKKASSKQGR